MIRIDALWLAVEPLDTARSRHPGCSACAPAHGAPPGMARASQSAANAWPASFARPLGGGRVSNPRWVRIFTIGVVL